MWHSQFVAVFSSALKQRIALEVGQAIRLPLEFLHFPQAAAELVRPCSVILRAKSLISSG